MALITGRDRGRGVQRGPPNTWNIHSYSRSHLSALYQLSRSLSVPSSPVPSCLALTLARQQRQPAIDSNKLSVRASLSSRPPARSHAVNLERESHHLGLSERLINSSMKSRVTWANHSCEVHGLQSDSALLCRVFKFVTHNGGAS